MRVLVWGWVGRKEVEVKELTKAILWYYNPVIFLFSWKLGIQLLFISSYIVLFPQPYTEQYHFSPTTECYSCIQTSNTNAHKKANVNWQRNSRTGTEPENNLSFFFPSHWLDFKCPFMSFILLPKHFCNATNGQCFFFFLHDFQVNSLFSKRSAVICFPLGEKNHNMRGEMIGIIRLNGGIEHNGKNIFYEDHLST